MRHVKPTGPEADFCSETISAPRVVSCSRTSVNAVCACVCVCVRGKSVHVGVYVCVCACVRVVSVACTRVLVRAGRTTFRTFIGNIHKNQHFSPRNVGLFLEKLYAVKGLLLSALFGFDTEVKFLHQRLDHAYRTWPPGLGVHTLISHNPRNIEKFAGLEDELCLCSHLKQLHCLYCDPNTNFFVACLFICLFVCLFVCL